MTNSEGSFVRPLRRILAVLGGGMALGLLVAAPAFAGSISSPGNPFTVPGDANGNPQPFDVSVTGFAPNSSVYIEQCDGTNPATPGWDPTSNCDNLTSPAGGITNANGAYTFLHTDANHAFHPFKGVSPSGSFNCLSPNDPAPNNGLPTFRNCQLRASSNNGNPTQDQSFITLQLPDQSGQVPEVPFAIVLPLGAAAIGGAFLVIRKRRAAHATA